MSTSQQSKIVGHASISKTENVKMSKSQHARFVKWKAPTNEECSDADFVCHSSDAVRERRHTFNHHVLLSLIGAFHFTIVAIPYSRNKLSAQGRAKTQIIRRFMDGHSKEKQGADLNPK